MMAIIWGSNFAVVRFAAHHIPELAFNCIRLLVGSALFLVAIAVREGWPRLTRREWKRVLLLALVGHVVYQLCYVAAVSRTTIANGAIIFAFTPITVALLTSLVGHERIPPLRVVGALISITGISLVVGFETSSEATLLGNVLAAAAMLSWAIYTVGTRPLLDSRSPLTVTGYSMAIGSLMYIPIAWGSLRSLRYATVPAPAWLALVGSAIFALFVAYMIWYSAVQTIGSSRTSMYSNLTPIAAMVVAAIWVGEPLTIRKLAGAATVMAGLAVSKIERQDPVTPAPR